MPFPGKLLHVVVPGDGAPHLAEGGKLSAGPWGAGVLVWEGRYSGMVPDGAGDLVRVTASLPHNDPLLEVPERLLVDFVYERSKDQIRITACRKDEGFTKEATERQAVAVFVRKYLAAPEEARLGMRTPEADCRLPKDGAIETVTIPDYYNATKEAEGSWRVVCRIKHSGGFGRGWKRAADFKCVVRRGPDGDFRIAQDSFRY